MRAMKTVILAFVAISAVAAQSSDPPLADTRLTVHTLVREDIFAGWMRNDMTRFARGERDVDVLLKERPDQRGNLLAWKAGATVYRAVLAHEAGKPAEFERLYAEARQGFAAAAKFDSGNDGVAPITGGTLAQFADRLPKEHRAAAWQQAYDAYSQLWKGQAEGIDKLPEHFKGEVLAGMAQTAQRTGRKEEAAQFIDRILTLLPNTPYDAAAKQWKADPASAATSNVTCQNCHAPGRLSARLAALNK
jgi:hypothetical protein